MKLRVLYHLAFWCFFIFIFWQQDPEATIQEYFAFFKVLGVSASVVYVNLYFLFPRYFFARKYFIYFFLLVSTIGFATLLLRIIFPLGNANFALPVFQHFINLLFIIVITSSFKSFSSMFPTFLPASQASLRRLESTEFFNMPRTSFSVLSFP